MDPLRMPALSRSLIAAARWALDGVLPRLCPGCDDELTGMRWLCGACRRRLRPVEAPSICYLCRAGARGARDREAGTAACEDPLHRFHRGSAAFWMEPPLDRIIHALKYGGRPDLGRVMGGLLARRIAIPAGALVVPLPLHRTRRRGRGYNQAECIARAAAGAWGAPVVPGVLRRARATRAQARLDPGRRGGNVAGAFETPDPRLVAGRSWVLVDDVATTGHTLGAAAAALVAAGAAAVRPIAFALA